MNAALVRYLASDAARSQRWIAPLMLFIAASAIFNSDVGPLLTIYAATVTSLFLTSIWITWAVTNSEDPIQAAITAVAVGGPSRLGRAKLLTAYLACAALGMFATLLPVALGNHSDRLTFGHVAAGAIGHLAAAGAGVAIGALLMQSVIPLAGWAFVVAVCGFLVEILVPHFPPVRQLLVLFSEDHPTHLVRSLAATSVETILLSGLLIAVSLRIARWRS